MVDGGRAEASLRAKSFSDVDGSGQADDHAAYLDRAAARVVDQRNGWIDQLLLEPGHTALDAGSGVGEVVRMLGARVAPGGRAVGVDLSAELVARAQERAADDPNVEYRVGDLTSLPFEDASFEAVYSERVFMHLHQPDAAMREVHRVLRPGGRLLVIDADHTRAARDADDIELAELMTGQMAHNLANPRSGRHLRSQAVLAGFTEVSIAGFLYVITDRDAYRSVAVRPDAERLAMLVADGAVTQERADAFAAEQDAREAEGRFQLSTQFYVLTARKASS